MKNPLIATILFTNGLLIASCTGKPEKPGNIKASANANGETGKSGNENSKPGPTDGEAPTNPNESGWPEEESAKPFSDPSAKAPLKDPAAQTVIHKYFNIHVVDAATKKGISGAVVSTVNNIRQTSDKNGFVAFYEPGLMNTRVYFKVTHPGWNAKKDTFGNAGVGLDIKEGEAAFIELDRASGQTVTVAHDKDTRKILHQKVPSAAEIFGIRLVDKASGRGIPLVLLKSSEGEEYWSDNFGYVAIDDQDLLGKELGFKLSTDGYESQDFKVKLEKGKEQILQVERRNIAERLYRSTGAGSYYHSTLLGYKAPVDRPHIDGLVMGQDTLNATVYKNKVFWIWQDTSRPAYPLGNFNNSGALADLPSQGNISQDLGFNRKYFVDGEGFSRAMTPGFEPANEPTWMGNLVTVPDASGNEKMFGLFGKAVAEADIGKRGWGVYDDASATFKEIANPPRAEYVAGSVLEPLGDPVKVRHGTVDFLYYGTMRVPAKAESVLNFDAYETYSPYESRSKKLAKNLDGSINYAWRKNAYPTELEPMKKAGIMQTDILHEAEFKDREGKVVLLAAGQLEKNWNNFRKRWVATIQQKFGSSFLGESWIAEADTPMGPWNFATKIISHDKYTFYNLQQHPFWDREGGRLIYIHGTYTNFFTNEIATPRHDYNQVLYRLDLADKRLRMPVAVYDLSDNGKTTNFALKGDLHADQKPLAAAFYAMESRGEGTIGLAWNAPECDANRRLVPSSGEPAAFFVLPSSVAGTDANEKLYEHKNAAGHYTYSNKAQLAGYHLEGEVGQVWKSSTSARIPVGEYLGDLLAHAGADQCLKGNGEVDEKVVLDGSLSRHLSGQIQSFDWVIRAKNFEKTATGIKTTVDLPKGMYFVELKVKDKDGMESVDRAMILVE